MTPSKSAKLKIMTLKELFKNLGLRQNVQSRYKNLDFYFFVSKLFDCCHSHCSFFFFTANFSGKESTTLAWTGSK
jgi:hypothetical protein